MTESTHENITGNASAGSPSGIWDALAFLCQVLITLSLTVFLMQPLVQLLMRFVAREQVSKLQYPDLTRYENAIDLTHKIMIVVAVTLFLCLIAYCIYTYLNQDLIPVSHRISLLSRETVHRLVPFFLFVLFSTGILTSTIVRGTSSWDMIGHWYMHESIFSYIIYAMAYFFCAMLLWSDKARRILLYLLIGTALPIHLLVMVNEWGTPITYFDAKGLGIVGVTAVFFNSNHYGYYIMLTLLTAALLFVYEKNSVLRNLAAVCGIAATVVLVINNTLGAYLAALFVLILFVIYCFRMDRPHARTACLNLAAFLLITILMSFHYDTILSSLLVLSDDVGMIIADPLESDAGGSGRWHLWKETVRHIPEHPLVGFGVEGLLSQYGIGTPHNEFLQYAAFFGLPVMLYYIAACLVVLWRVFKNHARMSDSTIICFFVTIGYLASSFFGVTIFYTTPFLYILLGMTYAEYLKNGKQVAQSADVTDSTATENRSTENTGQSLSDEAGQIVAIDDTQRDGTELTASAAPAQDSLSTSHEKERLKPSIEEARQQGLLDGLSQGRIEGAELLLIAKVCKKLQKQKTTQQIAIDLDEELSTIETICQAARETAPDYDIEAIFQTLHP